MLHVGLSQVVRLLCGALAVEDPPIPFHHPIATAFQVPWNDPVAHLVRRVFAIDALLVLGVAELDDEQIAQANARGDQRGKRRLQGSRRVEKRRQAARVPVRVADENGISERRRCYGVGFGGRCSGTRSEQNVCCRPRPESVEARLVCGAQQVVAQQRLVGVVHQTEIGICRAEPLARDSHEIALRRAQVDRSP